MLDFMIIKKRSAYNAVIRRPTLVALRLATLIYPLTTNFRMEQEWEWSGEVNMTFGLITLRV